MPHCKSTTIIDEIRGFFKKNDNKVINCIAMLIKAVKMTDKGLGLHSACNVTRKSSDKLQLLTLLLLQKYLSDTENFTKLINLGTLQQTG